MSQKKNSQKCFSYNFVKCLLNLIIFGQDDEIMQRALIFHIT